MKLRAYTLAFILCFLSYGLINAAFAAEEKPANEAECKAAAKAALKECDAQKKAGKKSCKEDTKQGKDRCASKKSGCASLGKSLNRAFGRGASQMEVKCSVKDASCKTSAANASKRCSHEVEVDAVDCKFDAQQGEQLCLASLQVQEDDPRALCKPQCEAKLTSSAPTCKARKKLALKGCALEQKLADKTCAADKKMCAEEDRVNALKARGDIVTRSKKNCGKKFKSCKANAKDALKSCKADLAEKKPTGKASAQASRSAVDRFRNAGRQWNRRASAKANRCAPVSADTCTEKCVAKIDAEAKAKAKAGAKRAEKEKKDAERAEAKRKKVEAKKASKTNSLANKKAALINGIMNEPQREQVAAPNFDELPSPEICSRHGVTVYIQVVRDLMRTVVTHKNDADAAFVAIQLYKAKHIQDVECVKAMGKMWASFSKPQLKVLQKALSIVGEASMAASVVAPEVLKDPRIQKALMLK